MVMETENSTAKYSPAVNTERAAATVYHGSTKKTGSQRWWSAQTMSATSHQAITSKTARRNIRT